MAAKLVNEIEEADLAVTEAVADLRHERAVRVAGKLAELGDQPPLVALSLATCAIGLVRRDRRMARAGARMLLAHALATGVKTVIKRSIDRTRPDEALDRAYRMERGGSDRHELSSLPSGHTAGAVAVAQAVARDYPPAALPARGLAAAIAVVQIPYCKHFVSDIAVGAVIGLASERVASAVVERVDREAEKRGLWPQT